MIWNWNWVCLGQYWKFDLELTFDLRHDLSRSKGHTKTMKATMHVYKTFITYIAIFMLQEVQKGIFCVTLTWLLKVTHPKRPKLSSGGSWVRFEQFWEISKIWPWVDLWPWRWPFKVTRSYARALTPTMIHYCCIPNMHVSKPYALWYGRKKKKEETNTQW